MKTFRILPWYFLVLIIGLCVTVMYTTEGMIVSSQTVVGTYALDTGVQVLKTKATEFINSTSKTKRNVYAIFLSDTYQGRTNTTNITNELNKNKTVDYIFFISKDNTKVNMVLKEISASQLSVSNDLIVLTVNSGFKPPMSVTTMYVPAPSTAYTSIKEIVTRFTTSAK